VPAARSQSAGANELANAVAVRVARTLGDDDRARSVDGDLVVTIGRLEVREPSAGWLHVDGG
jgi:hypothetical protein